MKLYVFPVIILFGLLTLHDFGECQPEKGLYEKLKGYAGEFGNVLKEVSTGLHKLGQQIRNFEEFLDATVDEDCYFECPPGQIAKPRHGHKPRSNGCGTYGLEQYITPDMLPVTGFADCCEEHDFCYDTCGADKDECDLKFKKCLYRKCSKIDDTDGVALKHKMTVVGCKAGAKLFYTGTTAVGCKSFLDAQQNACLCKPIKDEF